MDILVTGGTGFIGSHFVAELKKRNNIVILMRDLSSGLWTKWLNEALHGCTIVQGDLLNENVLRRILAEYNIAVTVHFAAQAIVSSALKDPFGTFQTNIIGTVNLLEACRQTDIKKIYVQSTDKIYGERMNAKEEDPIVSTGIYETSKACQDLAAQAFMETYGMHIVIARSCNAFGFDKASRIVSNTICSCLHGTPPIIYEEEKSKSVRQYIYVDDLVSAIRFLMAKTDKGIFNIATNDVLTQEEVVKKICLYFPISARYVKREKTLKEIKAQSMNWAKIKRLGWSPKFTFAKGIQETIKRFQTYGW